MSLLLTIYKAAGLIGALIVSGMETALRIKALLELDPDYRVSIQRLETATLSANAETKRKIEEWFAAQGLPAPRAVLDTLDE